MPPDWRYDEPKDEYAEQDAEQAKIWAEAHEEDWSRE